MRGGDKASMHGLDQGGVGLGLWWQRGRGDLAWTKEERGGQGGEEEVGYIYSMGYVDLSHTRTQ